MANPRTDIEKYDDSRKPKNLMSILKAAVKNSPEVVTGAVGSTKQQLLMIPGRLLQGARNGYFLEQLIVEIEHLKARGKIDNDYLESEECQSSLQYMLSALENPPVDQLKFDALKGVFLASALREGRPNSTVKPSLLLEITGQLSSGEIAVLAAAYKAIKKTRGESAKVMRHISVREWRELVAENSGLEASSLVELYEKQLVDKVLLTGWIYPDQSGAKIGVKGRLTDLGLLLCEYWRAYEKIDFGSSKGGGDY